MVWSAGDGMFGTGKMTRMTKGMHRGANGFTLSELMTALAVIAVLGLISSNSLQNLMAGFRAINAARQVATTLHMARMKAISRHTSYKVTFDPAGSYQTFRNNAGTWAADGQAVSLPAGVRFNRDSYDPITFANPVHEATFDPTGAATNAGAPNGGTVYLKGAKDQQKYRITVVGLTGRIKMWTGWQY